MKTFNLLFPSGLVIDGFEWTPLGWYVREFPDSGIHSAQLNRLRYTAKAIGAAGLVLLDPRIEPVPQFVAVNKAIMQGQRNLATAVSSTMAKRIARALNLHQPNERGV